MQTLGGIDILMSALVKVVIQPAPVYWLPWSVFIISGLPYRAIASSNASTIAGRRLEAICREGKSWHPLTGR